jgi:V/A-type H+-transporting ATPase subunit A
MRREVFELLQRDRELREVAALVGVDALEDGDRVVLESARLARELLVAQSAYDPADATSPIEKTHVLVDLILRFYRAAREAVESGRAFSVVDVSRAQRAITRVRQRPDGGDRGERAEALKEILGAAGATS